MEGLQFISLGMPMKPAVRAGGILAAIRRRAVEVAGRTLRLLPPGALRSSRNGSFCPRPLPAGQVVWEGEAPAGPGAAARQEPRLHQMRTLPLRSRREVGMIAFACPQCSQKFQVKDEFAGRAAKCPACKQPVVVPRRHRKRRPTSPPERSTARAAASSPPAWTRASPWSGGPGLAEAGPGAARPSRQERRASTSSKARSPAAAVGSVLRAVDRDIRREVAVKYMLDQADPQEGRFVEEAQITGQLEHPNIVPIYELGIDAQGGSSSG